MSSQQLDLSASEGGGALPPSGTATAAQPPSSPLPVQHDNVVEDRGRAEVAVQTPPTLLEMKYADREVLNVDEVAEMLRMEERLVYNSIKRNEIPGVRRFGKRGIIRVSRRVFFDWLHGRGS